MIRRLCSPGHGSSTSWASFWWLTKVPLPRRPWNSRVVSGAYCNVNWQKLFTHFVELSLRWSGFCTCSVFQSASLGWRLDYSQRFGETNPLGQQRVANQEKFEQYFERIGVYEQDRNVVIHVWWRLLQDERTLLNSVKPELSSCWDIIIKKIHTLTRHQLHACCFQRRRSSLGCPSLAPAHSRPRKELKFQASTSRLTT